jgi:hypothetical protein
MGTGTQVVRNTSGQNTSGLEHRWTGTGTQTDRDRDTDRQAEGRDTDRKRYTDRQIEEQGHKRTGRGTFYSMNSNQVENRSSKNRTL